MAKVAPGRQTEDQDGLTDFAPEKRDRHVDIVSLVVRLEDAARRGVRGLGVWFLGILLLLTVGVLGLVVWVGQTPVPVQQPAPAVQATRVPNVDQATTPYVAPPTTAPAPATEIAKKQAPPTEIAEKQAPATPPRPQAIAGAPSAPPLPRTDREPAPSAPAPEPAPSAPQPSEGSVTSSGSPLTGIEAETEALREVLGRYRNAFAALDPPAVRQVWPTVNQRSLERAFRQLQEQDVSFFSCTFDINADLAKAVCVGTTSFVPKVGNRSPQSGPSQWNFSLSKGGNGAWQIEDVQAR